MTVALVASTGGHLMQLTRLRPRLAGVGEVVWITFDSPQSRSLLAGERTVFVRPTGPRDLLSALVNAGRAPGLLRSLGIDAVISTGAAVAVSFMAPARALGIPCFYIESAARIQGSSLTARLLKPVPGVRFFTQYPAREDARWSFRGSVFDAYQPRERVPRPGPPNVVVTLGSLQGFGFRRLIERLIPILPADAEVLWQTGATDVEGLPIRAVPFMSEDAMAAAVADADIVIGHAGVGTALMALDSGRAPILVPRTVRHGEHVDDHQAQVATELADRGLALHRSVEQLSRDDLRAATRAGVSDAPVTPITLGLRH